MEETEITIVGIAINCYRATHFYSVQEDQKIHNSMKLTKP